MTFTLRAESVKIWWASLRLSVRCREFVGPTQRRTGVVNRQPGIISDLTSLARVRFLVHDQLCYEFEEPKSVTTRDQLMKQKQPPTWATKIDKEGLQFLTGVRYARRAVKLGKDPNEVRKFVTEVLPQILPGFAQGRKIVITSEMLERLKEAGMPMGENLTPGEHKLPENAARLFENIQMMQEISNDPQFPKAFPVVAAF